MVSLIVPRKKKKKKELQTCKEPSAQALIPQVRGSFNK